MGLADELGADDYRAVLELIGLLHDTRGADEFARTLMTRMVDSVACDRVTYTDINLRGGSTAMMSEPEVVEAPPIQAAFTALTHEHPLLTDFAATGDPRPRRMSDFIPLAKFQSLDLWREVFSPLETNYQLTFGIGGGPDRVIAVAVNRRSQDFSDRELAVAALLQRHLTAAFAHAKLRAESARNQDTDSPLSALTSREREVLAVLAAGRTNREIGLHLRIEHRTVDKHVENLRQKLGVTSRTAAAAVYLRSR
jgi:DNA-binding CsgD family transcriptional regulator